MFDDPDLTLFATVFSIGAVVVALVWFLLVVPAERRYHERKLQAIQEQIRQREEMLKSKANDASTDSEHSK